MVSVIIPAYRVTGYIGEAIDSVLRQTHRDFEIIVVNDACPDSEALEGVLEPYGEKIRYFKHAVNAGPSETRNTGIRAAQGEFVAFLDGDDLYEPSYLEVQLAELRDRPADMVYGSALLFGDDPCAGMPIENFRPSHGPVTVESILREKVNVLIMAVIRRDILFRAGLFDPGIRKCEDLELWLRIAKAGGRIVYHSRPIAKYRVRGDSASSDSVEMLRYRMIVATKIESEMNLTAEERGALADAKLRWAAESHLEQSKRMVERKRYREAAAHLREANLYSRSLRYSAAYLLMRWTPGLFDLAVRLRDASR